jgi:hypothetical protein
VIEIPTPRWTLYDSIRFNVKMDREVLMTIHERAVSSPIWYEPTPKPLRLLGRRPKSGGQGK